MKAVLLTGATGFLGGPLARRLVEGGADLHALARPSSDRARLGDLPVTWHEGDLLDLASVDRAVAALGPGGRVVHAAAVISYRRSDAELQRRANVEGTRAVVAACRAHGVARLLHVSSVVAVGVARDAEHPLDEEAPFEGHRLACDYVDTKRAAEELVLAAEDLDAVVVNPGAIFGPGAAWSNTSELVLRVAAGRLGAVAPPGGLSLVGVDDCAEGCVLALDRGRRGRRYLLVESHLSVREVLDRIAAAWGRAPGSLTAPRFLWRLLALCAGLVERVVPLERATGQSLRLLAEEFRFSGDRARRELGWSPRPFGAVLAETVAWLRQVEEHRGR